MMQTTVVSPDDKVPTQQILSPFHNSGLYGKHLADISGLSLHERGEFLTVESNRVCILGEDSTNTYPTCISFNDERMVKVR